MKSTVFNSDTRELGLSFTHWLTFEVDMQLPFSLYNNGSCWIPKKVLLNKLPSLLYEREGWSDYLLVVNPVERAFISKKGQIDLP